MAYKINPLPYYLRLKSDTTPTGLRVSARDIIPELTNLPGVFDVKPIAKS